jgi:hypothetical protein
MSFGYGYEAVRIRVKMGFQQHFSQEVCNGLCIDQCCAVLYNSRSRRVLYNFLEHYAAPDPAPTAQAPTLILSTAK